MRGTWCIIKQKDSPDDIMQRCAPSTPDAVTMMPHAMDSKGDHCRVISVTSTGASHWRVTLVAATDSVALGRSGATAKSWCSGNSAPLLYQSRSRTPERARSEIPRCTGSAKGQGLDTETRR
jgi:hypothetical protein